MALAAYERRGNYRSNVFVKENLLRRLADEDFISQHVLNDYPCAAP
jgi:hypothetical protein